jgi:hypothetical protein
MKKKKKHRSPKAARKVTNASHVQYFYGFFAVLAAGAVIAGFIQPENQKVLGASHRNEEIIMEKQTQQVNNKDSNLWELLLDSLPF